MASVDAQGRLGLGHALTLQRLQRWIWSRRGCCDLARLVTEGPLVFEKLCGVLAGEHCWEEKTRQ